jgi:hypothetical protein
MSIFEDLLATLFGSEVGGFCQSRRGHHFGPHSDLCLNKGCDAERGTWQWCQSEEADQHPENEGKTQ